MSQHTISQVGPSNEWNGQNGSTFVDYKLRLAGVEKVVVLTQKPESPVPQAGQVLDVDLSPHPKFSELLKAKKVQQPRPPGGGRPADDPATRASIESQLALRTACEYVVGMAQTGRTEGVSAEVVVETAKVFFKGLKEMQA